MDNQYAVVNIGNPKMAKKHPLATEVVKRPQHTSARDVDAESNPVQRVENSLRSTLLQFRTNKKLGQEQLAKAINQPVKDVKMLEAGKVSQKEAKQIALKIERVFKVKLL